MSGEVCTVDLSFADELFRMEIRTFFLRAPVFLQISQLSAGSASSVFGALDDEEFFVVEGLGVGAGGGGSPGVSTRR